MIGVYPDRPWEILRSDPKPRLSMCHYILNHTIIVADKEGDLVSLWPEGNRHYTCCLIIRINET
jgi:hypothetical protein